MALMCAAGRALVCMSGIERNICRGITLCPLLQQQGVVPSSPIASPPCPQIQFFVPFHERGAHNHGGGAALPLPFQLHSCINTHLYIPAPDIFPPRHYLFPSPLLSFVLVVAKQQAAPRNDLLIGSATHMGPWQKSD